MVKNPCERPQAIMMLDPLSMRQDTGYMPIRNYAVIGNMHTAALIAIDGSLDFLRWPHFDSPSVFCRLLDNEKGGHFSIKPASNGNLNARQQYLPSSNILHTTFYHEDGVCRLTDFFPCQSHNSTTTGTPLRKCIVRCVEAVRGESRVDLDILPAFNYVRDSHTTTIQKVPQVKGEEQVVFQSKDISLVLSHCVDNTNSLNQVSPPDIRYQMTRPAAALGDSVQAQFRLQEGQRATFVLETLRVDSSIIPITLPLVNGLQSETKAYWHSWLSQLHYRGRWQELIERSLLTLKLLTFEPTGAVVAALTFSLPESIGGERNWDYSYCWTRDASFTMYAFLRLGFKQEAAAYMSFMSQRFQHNRLPDGGLPIMFSIHGSTDIPEIELEHLKGYRDSKPVRVGNGAALHKQLDIYGELMDAIYLYNKYGKPVTYDEWLAVRSLITDYVCEHWRDTDMSIWEVRGAKQQFVYSKIMLWVSIDRALRLAEKRCFPCPDRARWLDTRDQIMEEVMEKGYSHDLKAFVQSYERDDVLDSAVLIAPLVFFIAPNDPRFTSTLDQILKPLEKGGLTSAGMVHRYDTSTTDDGLTGAEGAFSMCTFWLIEALTRAGTHEPKYLDRAVDLFENMLGFANHVGLYAEEIDKSGEQLGNTPQAFSHLALISAAFNLNKALESRANGI